MDIDELRNRFGYHPATPETIPLHENVRALSLELAVIFDQGLPEGREKALALTKLQEAAMWANAAIACNLAPLEGRSRPSRDEPSGNL